MCAPTILITGNPVMSSYIQLAHMNIWTKCPRAITVIPNNIYLFVQLLSLPIGRIYYCYCNAMIIIIDLSQMTL